VSQAKSERSARNQRKISRTAVKERRVKLGSFALTFASRETFFSRKERQGAKVGFQIRIKLIP
jgi:hypothetical protein